MVFQLLKMSKILTKEPLTHFSQKGRKKFFMYIHYPNPILIHQKELLKNFSNKVVFITIFQSICKPFPIILLDMIRVTKKLMISVEKKMRGRRIRSHWEMKIILIFILIDLKRRLKGSKFFYVYKTKETHAFELRCLIIYQETIYLNFWKIDKLNSFLRKLKMQVILMIMKMLFS